MGAVPAGYEGGDGTAHADVTFRQCRAPTMRLRLFPFGRSMHVRFRFSRPSSALLGLALGTALTATGAQAADAPEAGRKGSVGIAVVALKAPYAGYDTDRLAAPIISWEGRSFFFRGGSVGYRLHQTAQSELALTASPYVMRFKRRDSHDPQLRQLDNRSLSGMLGVSWRHQADWGVLQANAQAEVTGHGGGFSADARYAYPVPAGRVTFMPAVGVTYTSADLNDYYFGVSQREAARSGLAHYSAGSGVSPYMDIAAVMPLGPRWTATASIRRTSLADAVRDSPMTLGDHMDTAALSLSYGF